MGVRDRGEPTDQSQWPPDGPFRAWLKFCDRLHRSNGVRSQRSIAAAMPLSSPTRVGHMLRGRSLPVNEAQARALLRALGADGDEVRRGAQLFNAALAKPAKQSRSSAVVARTALTNLPRLPAGVFIGHDDLMLQLEQTLAEEGSEVRTVAVAGLGGVGKSELALQYAHRNRTRFPLIWWLSADNASLLENGLARLAAALVPAVASDPAAAAEWATNWLESNPGWLIVLDNLNDQATVDGLLARIAGRGRVIITTRRELPQRYGVRSLPVEVLEPAASVELLRRLLDQTDADGCAELGAALGYLPLALVQAAAYIRQTRTSVGHYLRLFAEAPLSVLRYEDLDVPVAVSRVWALTFEAIERHSPLAVEVLRLLTCFEPDNVPRYIVVVPAPDRAAIDEALGLLASYHMISLTEAEVGMHCLVHLLADVRLRPDGPDEHPELDSAAELLVVVLSCDHAKPTPDDWNRWSAVIPHAWRIARARPNGPFSIALAMLLRRCQEFIDVEQPVGAETLAETAESTTLLLLALDMLKPKRYQGSVGAGPDGVIEAVDLTFAAVQITVTSAHRRREELRDEGFTARSATNLEDAVIALRVAKNMALAVAAGEAPDGGGPLPEIVRKESVLNYCAELIFYAFGRAYAVLERVLGADDPAVGALENGIGHIAEKLDWRPPADQDEVTAAG